MSVISETTNLPIAEPVPSQPSSLKKKILVAISIIFAIGMVVTYAIGASWLLTFLFFSLALIPLFPLGKAVDNQRERILETPPK